jgi:hypothetical protein
MADTVIHILTPTEAMDALRISSPDECPNFELLLSTADDDLKTKTGHDWTVDEKIDVSAKLAAALFIISVRDGVELSKFYWSKITELHAKALEMVT